MPEVVNLNRFRKARQRAEAGATAVENRAKFGQTKAERLKLAAERDRQAQQLAGHRLGPEDGTGASEEH